MRNVIYKKYDDCKFEPDLLEFLSMHYQRRQNSSISPSKGLWSPYKADTRQKEVKKIAQGLDLHAKWQEWQHLSPQSQIILFRDMDLKSNCLCLHQKIHTASACLSWNTFSDILNCHEGSPVIFRKPCNTGLLANSLR